jgi:poly(beta-D-mannuronate) lyase
MATKQAEHQRKWDLAGLALVYLKVRRFAAPVEQEQIEAWLLRLAADARAFFDDAGVKRNNHWYWMGLGLAATSLGTGREPLWQAARQIFEDAMADIAADGTLPHELARGPRALYYHDFAVMPLVALLELAAQRGEDWASGRGKALERLVALTLAGHSDPTVFDRLAGARQERPVRAPAGWVALYAARHPDRVPVPPAGSRAGHRWLGGDVGVLRAALAAARD